MASARANRIKRVAEKRKEGKSLRVIAEEEGVSEPQVRRDIKDATATGDAVEPESGKVKGKDGKERPATMPKPSSPPPAPAPAPPAPRPVPPPPPAPAPTPAPAPVLDDSARLLHTLAQELAVTVGLMSAVAADPSPVAGTISRRRTRGFPDTDFAPSRYW